MMNTCRFVVLLMVLGSAVVPAAGGELKLSARIGLDDRAASGRWCPVRIMIDNDLADVDADLLLEVTRDGQKIFYRRALFVAKGFKGTHRMNFWCDANCRVRVRLVRRGTLKDIVRPLDPPIRFARKARVVGVYGKDKSGLDGVMDDWQVIKLSADDFPDNWLGYDLLDAVVLCGSDLTELNDWQIAALKQWIELGGELYVAAAQPFWQSGGHIDRLLPVDVGSAPQQTVNPVVQWQHPATDQVDRRRLMTQGKLSIAAMTVKTLPAARPARDEAKHPEARVLLECNGSPLIVRQPRGLGWVCFVGFAPDNKLPPDKMSIWPELLCEASRARMFVVGNFRGDTERAIEGYLRDVPGRPIPAAAMVLFMLLFCLAIGPLDYQILRRTGKFRFGLLTFAVIIGLFTAAAYYVSYAGRSAELEFRAISIVDVSPQANVLRGTSYCMALSPDAANHDLTTTVPDSHIALMRGEGERRAPTCYPGNEGLPLVELPMKLWTPKPISCRWIIDEYSPGADSAVDALVRAIDRLGAMKDCTLISRKGIARAGGIDSAIRSILADDNSGLVRKQEGIARFADTLAEQLGKLRPGASFDDWMNSVNNSVGREESLSALRLWLSFGPGDTSDGRSAEGLPTELSLRRNLQRGRVYLVAELDKSPLILQFSGTQPQRDRGALVRFDVTDLVDPGVWR